MNIEQLGQLVKSKHPQYQDMSDIDVAQKVISKFPQYMDMIDKEPTSMKDKVISGIDKTAKFFDKTMGRAANFMYSKPAEMAGSVIGAGVESGYKLFTGKRSKRRFTRKADELLGNPKDAAKNIALTAMELTTAGLGSKLVGKGAKFSKKPLTLAAEKLYKSALKPGNIKKGGKIIKTGEEISKIGLNERVWLTKGGVERVSRKIDDFEEMLGSAIEKAQGQGKTIKTGDLKQFVDEAKGFFKDQVNVEEANKAIKGIDDIYNNFVKKYGKEIPIEQAQKIKVKTGQHLKKYYNAMSSARIEGEKQMVRGLKEGIVKEAPQVKNINERLGNLYTFDKALSKANNRIGNYNLLGLPSKIAGGVGGAKGFAVGILLELADAPAIKSGAAISLDLLSKGAEKSTKAGRVPLSLIIANIAKALEEED